MARTKNVVVPSYTTGSTLYGIIVRESDGYLLNDADGSWAAAPADPYCEFVEHSTIKGRYLLTESREVWSDGWYSITIYKQAGGSPSPAADTLVDGRSVQILGDQAAETSGSSETIHAYALCTLAQMKTELNIATAVTTDNDRIIRAINAATDAIETYTNRKLKRRASATTEYYDGDGPEIRDNRRIWTSEWPLETSCITSIEDDLTRTFNGSTYLISASHYVIRSERYIELSTIAGPQVFSQGWQNIKLIYTPGYTTAPSDLQKACILLATDFYLAEKTRTPVLSSRSGGREALSFKEYDFPPTVVKLIDPYKRGWDAIPDQMAWMR